MRTFFLTLAAACILSSCACAAELTGCAQLTHRGCARDAVVYLEGARKSEPLSSAVVDQRDKMFLPHVMVVTQGTRVSFPNDDTVLHNVFAYYNAKKFDLGVYPRGASKHVTFDKPGVVALLCNVHSDMSAYIYVVDTPYFAVTDAQGRFQIRDVPPGTYLLHAWHESGNETSQSVIISANNPLLMLTLHRN